MLDLLVSNKSIGFARGFVKKGNRDIGLVSEEEREGKGRSEKKQVPLTKIFIQPGSPKNQVWPSRLGRPGDPYHSSQNHIRSHRTHHTRSAHGSFPCFLENIPEV